MTGSSSLKPPARHQPMTNLVCGFRTITRKMLVDSCMERPRDHPTGKRRARTGQTPLGRLGVSEDIAPEIPYLASDDQSSFVTGSELVIDGGMIVSRADC